MKRYHRESGNVRTASRDPREEARNLLRRAHDVMAEPFAQSFREQDIDYAQNLRDELKGGKRMPAGGSQAQKFVAGGQEQPPAGFELIPEEGEPPEGFELIEDPTLLQKMGQRFMGSDVEDPMPYTRLGSTIAGVLGLGAMGMKAGAVAGSPGGPVGAGIGAAVGGAAGALTGVVGGVVAPEAVLELSEALGITEPGSRKRMGLSQEDLQTVLEGELLLEAATGGGLAAARLGARGATRLWTGIGPARQKFAEEATRHSINMMPVQVGKHSTPRSFVSIFGRFPFIAGPLVKQGREVDSALKTAFENLPARIAVPASMNDVSADIFSHMKQLSQTIDSQFKAEYEAVFQLADQMKVKVKPDNTLARAEAIMAKIAAETPKAGKGQRAVAPASSLTDLRAFLHKSVLGMKGVKDANGQPGVTVPQSLRQMDSLLEAVDERIGEFVKDDAGLPLKYMEQLRSAIHMDITTLGRGQMGPGGAAPAQIGKRLREIDTRFTHTMREVFENVTANRLASVTKRGMGGIRYQQLTHTSVDHLADILMRGDAPSMVDDMQKMFANSPELMKKLASSVLDRRIDTAIEHPPGGDQLNIGKLAKAMGLGSEKGMRYQSTKKLLSAAGGLSIEEVDKLMEIGKGVASVEVPNVSTFIARRAGISGLKGATDVLIPGLAMAGGAAAANSDSNWAQVALGGLMFIGGGRAVSRALANPDSARALRYVLKSETSRVGRKAAKWMVFRGAIQGMVDAGEVSFEKSKELYEAARTYQDSWDEYDKQQAR